MINGQLFYDGFAIGLVFIILTTGMVIIASINKIIFIAYGMLYTIGAFTTWYSMNYLGIGFFPSLIVGLLGSGVVGALSYILIFNRLRTIEGAFLASLIAAMGLQKVLSQSAMLVFGTYPRAIPEVFHYTFVVAGININADKLMLIGISILVCLTLFYIHEKTRFGRAMRAVAYIPEAAALMGINSKVICLMSMSFACMIAGLAGGLLAPTYGLSPEMGTNVIWTVMLMAILGGLDSLIGAVFAGLLIGQILSFGQFYIGGTIQIILFVIIGIILYFRPNGLMGRGIDIGI